MIKKPHEIWKINDREINLTHLDKIFWPNEGYTKADLINYYSMIQSYILPYLKDRPESLNRFPNGIAGPHFYQKNFEFRALPDWADSCQITTNGDTVNYLLCQNKETLIYMINLGCIELNPWSSRVDNLDNPDFLVIDLDPLGISFDYVVEAALALKEVLDRLKIKSYPKTSGATGMHVYIPTGGKYTYEDIRRFANIIALLAHDHVSDFTSVERLQSKRDKKVYFDYLQNNRGQTLAAPYSVRPLPGAPVSTPLNWSEVKKGLSPEQFNIKNTFERLKKVGDIWKPVLGGGIDLENVLQNLK